MVSFLKNKEDESTEVLLARSQVTLFEVSLPFSHGGFEGVIL